MCNFELLIAFYEELRNHQVIRIHHLRTTNICTQFHTNQSNGLDILVPNLWNNRPTKVSRIQIFIIASAEITKHTLRASDSSSCRMPAETEIGSYSDFCTSKAAINIPMFASKVLLKFLLLTLRVYLEALFFPSILCENTEPKPDAVSYSFV